MARIDWSAIESEMRHGKSIGEIAAARNIPQALIRLWLFKEGHYRDYVERRRRFLAVRNRDAAKATAASAASKRGARGVTHHRAKRWTVIAPDGRRWLVHNLYQFVRGNAELFDPGDVGWKRLGGKRGTDGEYCNATAGLLNVRAGKSSAWKGWRIVAEEG